MIGINLENPGNLLFLRVIGIRWQKSTYIGKQREGGSAACRYGVFRAVFGVSGLSEENLEAGLEAVEVGA